MSVSAHATFSLLSSEKKHTDDYSHTPNDEKKLKLLPPAPYR